MYTGQIMMLAGCVMIAFSVVVLPVIVVVFKKDEKRLVKEIYGEIEERDER